MITVKDLEYLKPFEGEIDGYKVAGNIKISKDNELISVNGNITKDINSIGYFNYNISDTSYNKNITSINPDNMTLCSQISEQIMDEVKIIINNG